jgi:uncharacterized membrane protein
MSMLEHRLQILLDDERHRRITAVAQARGVSVASVVREAIDRGLAVLDAPDMPVGNPEALRAELEALRSRRA